MGLRQISLRAYSLPYQGAINRPLPASFNWHVLCDLGADVFSTRTNQAIIRILLQDMGGPTGNTAARENGRIHIDWNTYHVIDRSGIEIHVTVEALLFFYILLNDT